jgi:hypothetical protein
VSRSQSLRRLLALAALVFLALLGPYAGFRFGRSYAANLQHFGVTRGENLRLSLAMALGRERSFSQFGQDLWAAYVLGSGKPGGYYVDLGSGNGVVGSNTKLLDDRGWKGICIDAFPRNMQTRSCRVVTAAVAGVSGERVRFRAGGDWGGIESTLGPASLPRASAAPEVEFTTVTLDDILDQAKAPPYIDYMSVDIEGGELAALRALSFDRHKIGGLTIEVNYDDHENREAIHRLMTEKGYTRVRAWEVDDWYVSPEFAPSYQHRFGFYSDQTFKRF